MYHQKKNGAKSKFTAAKIGLNNRVRKKQIVLLSGTSKNGGGQVDLKGACPQDKFDM